MFEISNVYPDVPAQGRGYFRSTSKQNALIVVMRATTAMTAQYMCCTFQGHGRYSVQTYQVDIAEGDRFSYRMPGTALRQGDRRLLETLLGEGYLREYARLVATSG